MKRRIVVSHFDPPDSDHLVYLIAPIITDLRLIPDNLCDLQPLSKKVITPHV